MGAAATMDDASQPDRTAAELHTERLQGQRRCFYETMGDFWELNNFMLNSASDHIAI